MRVGVVKEIKDKENRVALTPLGAEELCRAGQSVVVQSGAGIDSGFPDAEYLGAGARLVTRDEAWEADLVLKVKEPLPSEYHYLRENILFTYLHLAGVPRDLTEALLRQKTTAIGYETVEDARGKLPLLAPMSAIAGNMAATIGSYYLAKFNRGKGVQLGMVLGTRHGKIVVVGDGVVGSHAARTASGMGAEVFIGGKDRTNETKIKQNVGPDVIFFETTEEHLVHHLADADLLVGAVLVPAAKAPYIVTRKMVHGMQPGSVIVDVSIDQGGCIETSRPTSHSDPVFEEHGVIHYCVTNMPAAYPATSTRALTTATLPYVVRLAKHGLDAFQQDPGFRTGVNTHRGFITARPVAEALGLLSKFKEFTG